ncbi:MAG: hypothetical protein ABR499_21970 [Gemmatimonadaceae bacterium]
MAQRPTVEAQRAALARRLRPLYAGLRDEEFEQMVARIAEIEFYGSGAEAIDIGRRVARRVSTAAVLPRAAAS